MVVSITSTYPLHGREKIIGEGDTRYILRVKDLPNEEKPREKLFKAGPKSLSMPELVAVIWGVGTKKEEIMAMSQRVLREYGEKAIANETNVQKLADALDIPLSKACQLVAGLELGRRFFAQKSGRPAFVRTAGQAHKYLQEMGNLRKEQLRALYLNSRYQVVHDEVISVGSLTANIVHPREVFQPAIEHSAVAIIIAHNHPSGSLKPTLADIEVTQQLKAVGKIIGIDLLDHLIVTVRSFKSII